MGIKKKQIKAPVVKKSAMMFLVGVDEDYMGSPLVDKPVEEKKSRTYTSDDEYIFEPSQNDISKFKDINFSTALVSGIDRVQIESELRGWGLDFDLLTDVEGGINPDQCVILNDYIDQNADYTSLTIVDILSVVILNCDFDWRKFTTILNDQNYDLLKLELGMKYHKMQEVGNASAFLKFD